MASSMITTANAQSQSQTFEDFIIVWLNTTNSSPTPEKQSLLRSAVHSLKIFQNENECLQFLSTIKNEKVFFIVSGKLNEDFVSRLQKQCNILSSFILNESRQHGDDDLLTHLFGSETRKVYTDIKTICEQIQKDTSRRSNNMIKVNVSDAAKSTPAAQDSEYHRQDASFLYSQILKDILVGMEATDESKREMINFCRTLYADDNDSLKVIDDFESKYNPDKAIWWFTCDIFLYRIINKALRVQDIDTLYSMRFFIRHLHDQLVERYKKQFPQNSANYDKFTVYRGIVMTEFEFEPLKNAVRDQYMSISSFLSTSDYRRKAENFANPSGGKSGQIGILFKVEVDVNRCQAEFAEIRSDSAEPDEAEILFTMGSVFRIQSISQEKHNSWNIHIKCTGEEDLELKGLRECVSKDVMHVNSLFSLARLMEKMGKNSEAVKYYTMTLKDPAVLNKYEHLSSVYTNLAACFYNMGDKQSALQYARKTVNLLLTNEQSDHSDLVPAYIHLALAHGDKREFEDALRLLMQAVEIQLKYPQTYPTRLAACYNNIGLIYDEQKRYTEALCMYEKCLAIRMVAQPANHPEFGGLYNNIAQLYQSQSNHRTALDYFRKAHEIKLHTLPPDHLDLALSYKNLAMSLQYNGQCSECFQEIKKAYAIYTKNPSVFAQSATKEIRLFLTDAERLPQFQQKQ